MFGKVHTTEKILIYPTCSSPYKSQESNQYFITKIKFESKKKEPKTKKMKFLTSFFLCGALAIDSTLMMLMMQQTSETNPGQAGQMNMILPLLLLGDQDNKTSDNTDMLMLMMMQGQDMGDMNSMLPFLMMGDDSLDFKSLFLMTNMMNQDCAHETDSMMNMLMPMLMMGDEEGSSDDLMMLMMMQSMGNSPVGMNQMMPFLMMNDKSEDDSLMMMVMLSSMTGGMESQQGFDNNFNMMLPMLLNDCEDDDDECAKKQQNMMIMMMSMQSQV